MAKEAKKSIFRDAMLKKANEVDKREDYIKVTSPRLWIVLIGIIILLTGFIIWGFLGRIETTVRPQTIYVQGGTTFFLVQKQYDGMRIPDNTTCTVSDFASNKEYKGKIIGQNNRTLTYKEIADTLGWQIEKGQENLEMFACRSDITGLADGVYHVGSVVTETVAPMAFVFSGNSKG